MLRPQVQIPTTPSLLISICIIKIEWGKDENKPKEAVIGQFLKKTTNRYCLPLFTVRVMLPVTINVTKALVQWLVFPHIPIAPVLRLGIGVIRSLFDLEVYVGYLFFNQRRGYEIVFARVKIFAAKMLAAKFDIWQYKNLRWFIYNLRQFKSDINIYFY